MNASANVIKPRHFLDLLFNSLAFRSRFSRPAPCPGLHFSSRHFLVCGKKLNRQFLFSVTFFRFLVIGDAILAFSRQLSVQRTARNADYGACLFLWPACLNKHKESMLFFYGRIMAVPNVQPPRFKIQAWSTSH